MKPLKNWIETIEPTSLEEMKENYPDILKKYPDCEFFNYSKHPPYVAEILCGSGGIILKKNGNIIAQIRTLIY